MKRLSRDVTDVALRAGPIELRHVAVDGTKIEADSGKKSVRSEKRVREKLATLGRVAQPGHSSGLGE
ncbi:MAG: hypothetical protein IIC02_12640 [Planctomycetes bacterium]|nr:hypothetical protein [Planctomycetota bacterium]